MKAIRKEKFLENLDFYFEEIKKGRIFIYPTDTIYGIGCDAIIDNAIIKIRQMKKRNEKPFSIMAPNKNWIIKNCLIDKNAKKWLNKLPGAYTLILKLMSNSGISSEVNLGLNSIGIRIPKHWFAEVIEKYGRPFVTTSVNISGEPFIKSLSDLKAEIKDKVDYFIDDGVLSGAPSIIVKLIEGEEEIIKR